MIPPLSPSFGALYLRRSLKRGLARQAVATARKTQADHLMVFADINRLGPSRRAMERSILRLRKAKGVVSAGLAESSMVLILRNACILLTRADGVDAFQEDGLIYTRIVVTVAKGRLTTLINRASFSLHALERFVERSDCGLGADYVAFVDTEAKTLLRSAMNEDIIEHNDDSYVRARAEGVWAGSPDWTVPEPDWGFARTDPGVPTFSARTFLSPDAMKPEVWLRWKADPCLALRAA